MNIETSNEKKASYLNSNNQILTQYIYIFLEDVKMSRFIRTNNYYCLVSSV